MKKTTKFALAAIALIAFSSSSFAQATATATATATIVTPISITKTVDMNFGNVAVQAATGGTVVMTPAGVRSARRSIGIRQAAGPGPISIMPSISLQTAPSTNTPAPTAAM